MYDIPGQIDATSSGDRALIRPLDWPPRTLKLVRQGLAAPKIPVAYTKRSILGQVRGDEVTATLGGHGLTAWLTASCNKTSRLKYLDAPKTIGPQHYYGGP